MPELSLQNPPPALTGPVVQVWAHRRSPSGLSAEEADQNRHFQPPGFRPDMHPSDLFDLRYNRGCIPGHNTYPGFRFVGKLDPNQMLLFVAGDTNPEGDRTGSAVVFNSIFREPPTKFSSPDITKADHDVLVQRAVLRAATKALGMVRWGGEGFHSVVIATDNEYIVKSIYERMPVWQTDGFKDENGVNIENKHFWKRLLRGMRKQEELGVQVQYWLIPKEWNEAVLYAGRAINAELDSEWASSPVNTTEPERVIVTESETEPESEAELVEAETEPESEAELVEAETGPESEAELMELEPEPMAVELADLPIAEESADIWVVM